MVDFSMGEKEIREFFGGDVGKLVKKFDGRVAEEEVFAALLSAVEDSAHIYLDEAIETCFADSFDAIVDELSDRYGDPECE